MVSVGFNFSKHTQAMEKLGKPLALQGPGTWIFFFALNPGEGDLGKDRLTRSVC